MMVLWRDLASLRVIRFTVVGLVGTIVLAVLAASVVLQGSRLGTADREHAAREQGEAAHRRRHLAAARAGRHRHRRADADHRRRPADRRSRRDGRPRRPPPGREGEAAHADRGRQLLDPRPARAGRAVALRRDGEQRGDRVPRRARAEECAAAPAARREAEGAGLVLRDRRRGAGRPERDLRLPRRRGGWSCATRTRARR